MQQRQARHGLTRRRSVSTSAGATDGTECGEDATVTQAGGVAVGANATASGPSTTNPIFASVAVGYNAVAHDNAVAIGNSATARFSGTVTPANIGINSAVAVGGNAVVIGSNTIAIGTTARAGTGFTINTPNSPVKAGNNITVVGGRAEANQDDATAVGANSEITAEDGTALGTNTVVSPGRRYRHRSERAGARAEHHGNDVRLDCYRL